MMKERVFRYGENNRGLGMLTLPIQSDVAPIVVMLNAGLLHRAEPYRLNVEACRLLSEIGYISLRVDISGKGDTPPRENLTNRDSVTLDWKFIKKALEQEFGKRNIIIFGLCSGADNGIKLAAIDEDVVGLILLDPISRQDAGFARRCLINKITNAYKWVSLPRSLYKKIARKFGSNTGGSMSPTALRDEPYESDMQQCFEGLVARKGRILAVFTGHALTHYNQKGQFCRAMNIGGLDSICQEVFWPNASHLYLLQVHRDKLLNRLKDWGTQHAEYLRKLNQP